MRLSSISPVSLSLTAVALVYLSAASLFAEALPATVADQPSSFVSYDHHRVVRVNIQSEDQLRTLSENEDPLQFDYFTHHKTIGGSVDIRVAPEHFAKFQELKLNHKVLIDNPQPLLDQERKENERYRQEQRMKKRSETSAEEWFKGYHTYEENQNWLNSLVQSHPMISSLLTLGKSHQGRDITGIKIGNGPNNVVIIGLQRARDWITVPVVQYIIKQLVTRNDAHLEKYTFHIIPATNPDGYVYTWTTNRNWSKTRSQNGLCYGVDLSRNWDYKWSGAGASTMPCSDTYAGPSASSEVEATLVAGYLKSLQKVALLIDFYAFGQLWTYPYHYSTLLPDNNVYLDSLARKAVEAIKQPYGTLYKAGNAANIRSIVSGTLMDYVYGTNITRAAFTVYLRDHGQYGFVLPRELVLPTVEETWAGVAAVLDNLTH